MLHRIHSIVFLCLAAIVAFLLWSAHYDRPAISQIPILHDGRVKPMESFAAATLKTFSGSDHNAMPWLTETIFNPAQAEKLPVLKVTNPDVRNLLNLKKRKGNLFSYQEVSSAVKEKQDVLISIIQTPEQNWTPAQRDAILLQKRAVLLSDLLNSLTLFLPLNIQSNKAFTPAEGRLTYLETIKFQERLRQDLQKTLKAKGQDLENYTPEEENTAYLAYATNNLRENGRLSQSFKIIPGVGSQDHRVWRSPWAIIFEGGGSPQTTKLFELWQAAALAYHHNDAEKWHMLLQEIHRETLHLADSGIHLPNLQIEHIYNALRPFHLSVFFYAIALIVLLTTIRWQTPHLPQTANAFLCAGAFMHAVGITLRVYILERPPVSTLYESILFVGLVVLLYGLWAYKRSPKNLWLYICALSGILLHILGFAHDQDGDSMLMLTAVLNTNFWLATHVICISAGYAFCLVTSGLAHYTLINTVTQKTAAPDASLFKYMHTAALIALLFTAVGTVLGGIWADQSWGRFWGWDPKENGALLIVLWLIWILHGRISGQIRALTVTAGLAWISVIVALSWFGVNLLGVGLHSYGFTDSMAVALFAFMALETGFVVIALRLIQLNQREPHAR